MSATRTVYPRTTVSHRLYANCFNRPFDDQSQTRIAEETEAVFAILQRIEDGEDGLVWSAVLRFENSQHPMADRRDEIARWAQRAVTHVDVADELSARAQELAQAGFQALDAVHLASAEAASCDRFLTCDDRLLKRAGHVNLSVQVRNPVNYLEDVTGGETNGG